MNKEKHPLFDEIDDYLNNSMSVDKKSMFENSLKNDVEFKKLVEKHKLLRELVIANKLKKISSLITETHEKYQNKQTSIKIKKIIALITGVVIISAVIIYITNNTSNKNITQPITINKTDVKIQEETTTTFKQKISSHQTTNIKPEKKTIEATGKLSIKTENKEYIETSIKVLNSDNKNSPSINNYSPIITEDATPNIDSEWICSTKKIKIDFHTKASCKNESSGNITWQNITGGKEPYSTSVWDADNKKVNDLNTLNKGIYTFLIIDKDNCEKREVFIISEKDCEQPAIEKSMFNPFDGETWSIPNDVETGTLRVYDRTGSIYFEKSIITGYDEICDGKSSKNNTIQSGNYIYEIEYPTLKSKKGRITIIK